MDLHQKEIQGFFSFPVDNLRASPFLLQYIQEEVRSHQQTPPCPQTHPVQFSPGSDPDTEGTAGVLPLRLDAEAGRQGQQQAGPRFSETLKH